MQREIVLPLRHHVLIIDDNPDLVESLSCLLEYYGCRVEVAHDGREGLRKAIDGRPDVIFIDIAMPGMTGYDVARAIRSTLRYKVCSDRADRVWVARRPRPGALLRLR